MMSTTLRPASSPASFVALRSSSPKYAGTVITASLAGWPSARAASSARLRRTWLATAGAEYSSPWAAKRQSASPICRFTSEATSSGLILAWRLACTPTTTSVGESNSTTDGVVGWESALMITAGLPYSSTCAMHEYVVPRSMPKTLLATETSHAWAHRSVGRMLNRQPVYFDFGDTDDRAICAHEPGLHRAGNSAVGRCVGRQDPPRTGMAGGVEA